MYMLCEYGGMHCVKRYYLLNVLGLKIKTNGKGSRQNRCLNVCGDISAY